MRLNVILAARVKIAIFILLAAAAGHAADGARLFRQHCAACHGADAHGGGQGPGLAGNPHISGLAAEQLRDIIHAGFPNTGMPPFDLPPVDLDALAAYLRTMNVGVTAPPPAGKHITWGKPQPGDWLTYNGNYSGNRYSSLRQIDRTNAGRLSLKWIFPIPYYGLEVTPLESSGVMYVSGPNQVYAIDAANGNQLWKWSRPQTRGLTGDAALGTNRGVAIRDDLVFFETDNAHLLALARATGDLVWEKVLPEDPKLPYGGTTAPLIIGDKVIVGIAGGDHGIRGFLSCYQAKTGELLWRRWTVPAGKDEPGAATWIGNVMAKGGGSTWLTGAYDEATDTLYWPTGNPWPDGDDRERGGDNLYTNCILAINPNNGEIKWHYQFTPHDLKDRDATEPPVLVDTKFHGEDRKLLLHADRNGFFYVLDRITGKLLFTAPFLRRVDWATGIGPDGRPQVVQPKGCPSDAANWSAAAFSSVTRLFYFLALEECTGVPTGYPDQTGQRYLRALNIETGKIAWEVPQPDAAKAKTWSGVLATAGGVVFYGKPNGGFEAVDDRDGKMLWRFETNTRMKASPMTFEYNGKQYIAVAAGPNILCFGL